MPEEPEEVRKFLAARRSKGAKTTNRILTGTETARKRASGAATVRWAKYYAENPDKITDQTAPEIVEAANQLRKESQE